MRSGNVVFALKLNILYPGTNYRPDITIIHAQWSMTIIKYVGRLFLRTTKRKSPSKYQPHSNRIKLIATRRINV